MVNIFAMIIRGFLVVLCIVLCSSSDSVVTEVTDNVSETTTNIYVDTTYPSSEESIDKIKSESNIFVIPRTSRKLSFSEKRPAPVRKRTLWISDSLSEVLWNFTPSSGIRPKCNEHSKLYKQRLENQTIWAVQIADKSSLSENMFDSSAKSPNGLFHGNAYVLGHFDECISVNVPSEDVSGKYCLADIEFAPSKQEFPSFYQPHPSKKYVEPDPNLHVWDKLKPSLDIATRNRNMVHWALCVPASCTAEDVEASLEVALYGLKAQGFIINSTVGKERCYSPVEDKPLSVGTLVVCGIFLLAVMVANFATFMDLYYYKPQEPHNKNIKRWLKPFSMYTNMCKLIKGNPNKEFAELHLFKMVSMLFVISGHRQLFQIGQTPLYNVDFVEKITTYFLDVIILNGGIVVDSFFLISGFLTCLYVYRELEKRKRFNLIAVIVNRWIRIAPVYMFVVAFYAYVFPYIGDGPLWTEKLTKEATRCQDNWWTNLLFINNYVHSDNQCMVQSWYLACDMHFFIFGSVLVYVLWRWKRVGQVLLWSSLTLSILTPAYITYYNQYYGVVLHYMSLMKDPMASEHYRSIYVPSHTRAGSYIVGIIAANIYMSLKKRNYKFSKTVMVLASIGFASMSIASLMAGWLSYSRGRPYYQLESAIYAGTHRCFWAVGVAWFIIAEGTTGFGSLYNVMKHRLFTPFGRLTYCVFLIHTIPQIYYTASARVPGYLSIQKLTWIVTGDATLAYMLALYLNLLFEAPLERLQKKILKKLMKGGDTSGTDEKSLQKPTLGINNPALQLQEKV